MKKNTLQEKGLKLEGKRVFTRCPWGDAPIYDERIFADSDGVWREWNPYRSKLAAYILKGGEHFPFSRSTTLLYLGVAQGTTASHISDICTEGRIYGVEISPEAIRKFLKLAERRENLYPVLADASRPELYADIVPPGVDVIYQDIAQRTQVEILIKNAELFLKGGGYAFLMLKARSVDVAAPPDKIYADVRRKLVEVFEVLQERSLKPYQKDHRVFVLRYR